MKQASSWDIFVTITYVKYFLLDNKTLNPCLDVQPNVSLVDCSFVTASCSGSVQFGITQQVVRWFYFEAHKPDMEMQFERVGEISRQSVLMKTVRYTCY